MAVTSVGFTGTVTEADWSKISTFGSQYSVLGAADFKVSIVSGVDRTVRVATGSAWGKGILVTSDATVDVQLGVIASGSRWDTIVIRRNRALGSSSVIALAGTSTKGLSASRHVDWASDHDDQPIALARVTAGQSNVQEVVDLRCWAGGAVYAADAEALSYLGAGLGAAVTLPDGSWWQRSVTAAGTLTYQRGHVVDAATAFVGTYTGQATSRYVDRKSWTTDANGDVIVMYAADFTGILTANMVGADVFPLTFAFRMLSGNLVARVWQGTSLRTNTAFVAAADVLYW